MKTDFQRLFKAIGDVIVEALRPITAKLVELEARKPEKGERGDKGETGALGELGPPGVKGDPGIQGERGEKGIVGDHGERGEPGLKGDAGERGERGLKGESGDRGEPGVKGDAGEPGERGGRGEKGDPGERGAKGEPGEPGEKGTRGIDGKDGESVAIEDVLPILDGAVAKWMLEVERRIMDLAQRAVDGMPKARDGKDGIDGKDGLNADEFQFNFDLEKRTFSATHKDRVLFSQRIPYPKYMDVWSERLGEYEKGFMVTFGGSVWIAKRDTTSKPGTDDSWQLCVKKGRDGK